MSSEFSDPVTWWRVHRDDHVVLDGFHAIKHALRFGADVRVVLSADVPMLTRLADDLAPDVALTVTRLATPVSQDVLATLVRRPHPTRVAALASRPNLRLPTPRTAPVITLDNPRHLGNAGAVVRLAAGFGLDGVLTTGDVDPWHPAVVRAAAGLHFATAVSRVDEDEMPRGPLFVLDAKGDDLRDVTVPDDAVLVFGSERHGVSRKFRDRADLVASLPMRPKVSSYNLATSVAMTVYAWAARKETVTGARRHR